MSPRMATRHARMRAPRDSPRFFHSSPSAGFFHGPVSVRSSAEVPGLGRLGARESNQSKKRNVERRWDWPASPFPRGSHRLSAKQVSWLSGPRPAAGLPRCEPSGRIRVAARLTDHSGGSARDSHPLPYSLRLRWSTWRYDRAQIRSIATSESIKSELGGQGAATSRSFGCRHRQADPGPHSRP